MDLPVLPKHVCVALFAHIYTAQLFEKELRPCVKDSPFYTARALALASLGTWPTCSSLLPTSAACGAPPLPAHSVEDDRGDPV